jgi:hypothetical protein
MKFFTVIFVFCFWLAVNAQSNLKWNDFNYGIEYANLNNAGVNIFIGYGGWSAKQEAVRNWVENLYYAKLNSFNISYLFSVKGPDSPCYEEKEIADSLFALKLINICAKNKIQNIIIAAHSSGSFVAHNLFQYLFGKAKLDKNEILKDKIIYFNLDGGIGSSSCGAPLDSNTALKLKQIYAVYAYDSLTDKYSSNYETMILLGNKFPNSQEIKLDVTGCGCTGKWCIHDALIIKKPYNPEKFDLVNDYGSINNERPVQVDYFNVLKNVE